ncbi:MAG TPA: hypothetical protein VE988_20530 [Gemmataceae bacterium]|nr:hypothetical protein [Gemmataceae bacterium]
MLRYPYQILPVTARRKGATPGKWAWMFRRLRTLFGKTPESLGAENKAGPLAVVPAPGRPFVPVRIGGLGKSRRFRHALIDTGSEATVFPSEVAPLIGVVLGGHQDKLHWRGQSYSIEFQSAELELEQSGIVWRWRAKVGFSSAPLAYPLLGHQGCLEYMDANFCGADHVVELDVNRLFPGTVTASATPPK